MTAADSGTHSRGAGNAPAPASSAAFPVQHHYSTEIGCAPAGGVPMSAIGRSVDRERGDSNQWSRSRAPAAPPAPRKTRPLRASGSTPGATYTDPMASVSGHTDIGAVIAAVRVPIRNRS
ncbi:hypothetical protein GOAMR_43_00530 [Gordonia amarae NBRC 15530]|uniref:Uncharacterized protein n=1 Tax=Gordonia amarae NBRC 15530 TaxID=1075090 RepID=G7GQ84_9ACTN|nr:hypothetical protein GOAMR_43_00530 [Gordonia amarae NBRC 15530]